MELNEEDKICDEEGGIEFSFGFIPEDCFDLILTFLPNENHYLLSKISKIWREKIFYSPIFLSSKHNILLKSELEKPKSMNDYVQENQKKIYKNPKNVVVLLNNFITSFQIFKFDLLMREYLFLNILQDCVTNFKELKSKNLGSFIVICDFVGTSSIKKNVSNLFFDSCDTEDVGLYSDILIDKDCCTTLKIKM